MAAGASVAAVTAVAGAGEAGSRSATMPSMAIEAAAPSASAASPRSRVVVIKVPRSTIGGPETRVDSHDDADANAGRARVEGSSGLDRLRGPTIPFGNE